MKTFQLKEGSARVQEWNNDPRMLGCETYFDKLGPVQFVVTPMGKDAYQIQLMFMVDHIILDDAGGVVRGQFNQVKASEERLAKDADLVLKQPGIKGKIMTELAEDKVKALMQHVIDSEKKQHMDITPNTDGPPVHIGPDGLCKCGEHSEHSEHSDPCPLGKIKGVEKCTSRELMAAGVSCIIESDPDDVASPAAYGAIDPLGDDVTPEGKTFNGVPVPVKIGLDGMCKCGDSDPCPLAIDPTKGRKPYHQKCSVLHLINEGVPYVVEADDVAHQPGPETFPLNDDVVEHEIHSHPGDEELADEKLESLDPKALLSDLNPAYVLKNIADVMADETDGLEVDTESFTDAAHYLNQPMTNDPEDLVGPIPIVKMGPDHLCNCGSDKKCPLGKTGSSPRCSTSELKAAGVPFIQYDSYVCQEDLC